jgi:sodium-dependent dicarboxylate transporter 2/3/5
MVTWWLIEAIPMAVTALLPILLFPLYEILTLQQVTASYGNPIIYLFFGGFVIALAMQKTGLHKRIALSIIKVTGSSSATIIAGFMIATAFISMWVSNTATTLMMTPIAFSLLQFIFGEEKQLKHLDKADANFTIALMLGIAYAANVGGIATIIGTPPNAVLIGYYQEQYNYDVTFAQWLVIGLPVSLLMLLVCWLVLTKVVYRSNTNSVNKALQIITQKHQELGAITKSEVIVIVISLITIFLWMFKKYLGLAFISDTAVAIFASVMLFIAPSGKSDNKGLLNWEDTKALPWGILLLFGGGLSIAAAMTSTGLVNYFVNEMSAVQQYGLLAFVFIIVIFTIMVTEVMSNVALTTMLVPIIAGVATAFAMPISSLIIPIAISSSCAFMLPMASPPNAIVFSSNYLKISHMVRAGVLLNFIAVILVSLLCYYIIPLSFTI